MKTIKKWFDVIKGDKYLSGAAITVAIGIFFSTLVLFGSYSLALFFVIFMTVNNYLSIKRNEDIAALRDLNYLKKNEMSQNQNATNNRK